MPEIPAALAKFTAPQRRLVVVSNRTAAPGEARAGGLAVALGDALGERGGLWFGWSGTLSANRRRPHRVGRRDRVRADRPDPG